MSRQLRTAPSWGDLCCVKIPSEGQSLLTTGSLLLQVGWVDLPTYREPQCLRKFSSGKPVLSRCFEVVGPASIHPLETKRCLSHPVEWCWMDEVEEGSSPTRSSPGLPVTHPLFLFMQWWSETFQRCSDYLLRTHVSFGEGYMTQRPWGTPVTSWAKWAGDAQGPWPPGPLIPRVYSPPS